jgi:hypothetical protein
VRNERLLREAELWSVAAGTWPAEELDHLWKELLVQQFHDILPGSSIAWVHRDAEEIHAVITGACHVDHRLRCSADRESCLANPAPWPVSGVVVVGAPAAAVAGELPRDAGQTLVDGTLALAVELPALASVLVADATRPVGRPVTASRSEQGIVVDNGMVRLTWDPQGRLSDYVDLATGRPVWTAGDLHCGLLVRPDAPAEFDAWDIDEPDSRHPGVRLDHPIEVEVVDDGPLVVTVRVRHADRRSTFTHDVTVTAGSARVDHLLVADWHETNVVSRSSYPPTCTPVRPPVGCSSVTSGGPATTTPPGMRPASRAAPTGTCTPASTTSGWPSCSPAPAASTCVATPWPSACSARRATPTPAPTAASSGWRGPPGPTGASRSVPVWRPSPNGCHNRSGPRVGRWRRWWPTTCQGWWSKR